MGFFISFSMRYHKLSEAQLHEMHEEFAVFLASQGINKKEWDRIKEKEPDRIEDFLASFSDLVWEKILSECSYLEFTTPDQAFLFKTGKNKAEVLVLKIDSNFTDLTSGAGFEKALSQLDSDQVALFHASKPYTPSRNEFIYEYLKKGAELSKGDRFNRLQSYFSNSVK